MGWCDKSKRKAPTHAHARAHAQDHPGHVFASARTVVVGCTDIGADPAALRTFPDHQLRLTVPCHHIPHKREVLAVQHCSDTVCLNFAAGYAGADHVFAHPEPCDKTHQYQVKIER